MMLCFTSGFAGDCSFLGIDPMKLRDTQLLYLPSGGREWLEVDGSSTTLGNQTLSFAYVIQEKIDQSRGGVAVVKSGRFRQLNEPALDPNRRIQLVRNTEDADPTACTPVPASTTSSVPTKSYDAYHDRGLRADEQQTIDAFHYTYAGRKGSCRATNATDRDANSRRTNRGQFSFDQRVVKGQASGEFWSYFSPGTAVAASSNLTDQRVEMQAYRVRRGFPSCIRFSLAVPPKAGFVRINDLEGLKESGVYYVRSDERDWTLSR